MYEKESIKRYTHQALLFLKLWVKDNFNVIYLFRSSAKVLLYQIIIQKKLLN